MTRKKIWLVIYMFLAIFQPPFLPVATIYIFGLFTVLLLIKNNMLSGNTSLYSGNKKILTKSGLSSTYMRLIAVALYLVVVSVINILFLDPHNIVANRLQCLNQLLVLTGIEFLAVWYILKKADEMKLGFNGILELLVFVGMLQGLCAIAAYCIPAVRAAFIRFGGDIYQNEYVISRRGYGFSTTLLDTFGYGMGLIAGCALIFPMRRKSIKILALVLCIFSILFNSRTGLVVLSVAIVCFILKGGTKKRHTLYYILAVGILAFLVFFVFPYVANIGSASSNVSIKWASNSILELYNVILFKQDLNSATFLSNLTTIPTKVFEFLFGTGHSVYGLKSVIGFHSDVGYINLLWTYGLVGTVAIACIFVSLFVKAFKRATDKTVKFIVVFFAIAYVAVMLKAILLSYNPGVMVTYIVLFAAIYYGRKKRAAVERRKKCVAVPVRA